MVLLQYGIRCDILVLAETNPMWHWVQLKQSMSQLVQLFVRQYGWGRYCLIYLISSWILLVYIVTTRVVWSCQITWCSMTSWSMSRSSITNQGYGVERSSEAPVCCDGWTDSWCVDKAWLARVRFDYFRERLGVLQIEVPSKGKWWFHDPFLHGGRIGSSHG